MRPRVRLFGRPEVEFGRQKALLPAERRALLLAVLALQRAPVQRDWLAGLFWPDRDNATARRNLRKLAFDAQELDWAAGIESGRSTLAWPVETDVEVFDRAAAAGDLDELLKLYRGPLMDGLDDPHSNAFTEFLRRERTRRADLWHSAALARIGQLADRPQDVLGLAGSMLAADSLDEEAVAAAMRAEVSLGHTAGAVRLFREFRSRLADTLAIEPSSQLRELARQLEGGDKTPQRASLPTQPSIVGRHAELLELNTLLARSECRLLTISGPGGIGKSRLAKASLPMLEPGYADGTWWIPLDDLDDAAAVAPRVAQMLGIELQSDGSAIELVGAFLGARQILLVLDNSEQIQGLAALVERLLALAPRLKLIATSRRRLGVEGEWVLPLSGLAVPPANVEGAPALAFDAMQLFALRAREARPEFNMSRDIEAATRLVRRLGGLPLAIELAAHWVRLLPISVIDAEVASSLDVLEREEEGDERPEHRSVRATFERSWRWLAPQEQRTLALLTVFVGTCTRAAAKEIAEASLPVVASLVEKSLLQSDTQGRFSLHPLIHQFSREKLALLGLEESAARRHGEWFHRLFARQRSASLDSQGQALAELERDFENFRAAWHWAISVRATELLAASATALMWFGEVRGRPTECIALLERAAIGLDEDRPSDQRALKDIWRAQAHLLFKLGQLAAAVDMSRRALKLGRLLADRDGIKGCLNVMGLAVWQLGRHGEAKQYFEQALRRARSDGDSRGVAAFLANLGLIEKALGNFERARALYLEAHDRQRQLRDPIGCAVACNNLGELHCARREWEAARPFFVEGLEVCEQHGLDRYRPFFLYDLALVALRLGDVDRADDLSNRALEEAREACLRQIEAQALLQRAIIALRRQDHRQALDCIRRASEIATLMRSEPIQLECLLSLIDLYVNRHEFHQAAAVCAYVVRHPATEAAERVETEARLAQLVKKIETKVEPEATPLDALLRQLTAESSI